MISPGVKRPPPIGSELGGRELGLEGVRGGRAEGGGVGVLRGGGAEGAIVSCVELSSSESIVAAALGSSDPPQEEQNRFVEETCAPQEEQYMGKRDSIIARWLAATYRKSVQRSLRDTLDQNGGAVGQHLGDALHDFRGIILHGDDGVSTMLTGMLQEQFVSIFPRFFAEVRENSDIPPNDGLQCRS